MVSANRGDRESQGCAHARGQSRVSEWRSHSSIYGLAGRLRRACGELSSLGSWRIAAPCRDTDRRIARFAQPTGRDRSLAQASTHPSTTTGRARHADSIPAWWSPACFLKQGAVVWVVIHAFGGEMRIDRHPTDPAFNTAVQNQSGLRPSFLTRVVRVLGLIPRSSAAPPGP
jgi:hypothetical protein